MEEKNWPENIKYWSNISEKTAELAINQTESLLKETMATGQSIQDKAEKLTAFIITTFSALITYVLSHLEKWKDILHLTAIFSIIVLLMSLWHLYNNLRAYTIRNTGNDAEIYINNEFINNVDTAEEQFIQISLQVCKEYKDRTDINEASNLIRSTRNEKALKTILLGLIASPVLAFILDLLLSHHFLFGICL